jgi:hypothetical protein
MLIMTITKWSDDGFLDGLRLQGDFLADGVVERLTQQGDVSEVNRLFRVMRSDNQPLPPDLPPPILDFLERTSGLPAGVDLERIQRGEAVYMLHAFTAALILLAKSLPEGYQAPCLTEILMISRDLARSPYDRLLGVLQMLVRVCSVHGFKPRGDVVVTAQKMRLLHAGVRTLVPSHRPGYEQRYGVPVNHEDMLATLMAFSYLVIEGLQQLGVGLADQDAEDLYYLWQVFARMMGIHPADDPDSTAYIPQNVAQAAEFYASYSRRHYAEAAQNPAGVTLANDNLEMLQSMIPRPLAVLGLHAMPQIYMWDLMGAEACGRLGISPVSGHALLKEVLLKAVHLEQRIVDHLPAKPVEAFSQMVFQCMIDQQYGGQVEFLIPDSMATLHRLAPEQS